jgi:hypothetical protein
MEDMQSTSMHWFLKTTISLGYSEEEIDIKSSTFWSYLYVNKTHLQYRFDFLSKIYVWKIVRF